MKHATILIIGAISLFLAVWFVNQSSLIPSPLIAVSQNGWSERIHASYNAYFTWRDDALMNALDSIFLGSKYFGSELVFSLLFFYFGLYFLFACGLYCEPILSSLSAAFGALTLLLLFGWDALWLQAVGWWPFFTGALLVLARKSVSLSISALVTIVAALLLSVSAFQISSLFAGLSIWFVTAASKTGQKTSLSFYVAAILTLAICLVVGFYAPLPYIPDYPPFSHVVPDDGLPGNIMPLVGTYTPLPIVDREAVRLLFGRGGLVLLLLSLPLVWRFNKERPAADGLRGMLFLLLALLLADTRLPESIAQIMPLEVLPRVIPGLAFFPLAPLIFICTLVTLMCVLTIRGALLHLALSFLILSSTVFNAPNIRMGFLQVGSLQLRDSDAPLKQLFSAKQQELAADSLSEHFLKLLVSPSYYLIRKVGVHVLKQSDLFRNAEFISCMDTLDRIETTPTTDSAIIQRMCDGRRSTRWSLKTGQQIGNESITLRFKRALYVRGIDLDTGKFGTDFPRGLMLECGNGCLEGDSNNAAQFSTIQSDSSYQGEIKYTEKGYPYFGGQDQVKVIFSKAYKCDCLRINQIGKAPNFDWSVAELRLLMAEGNINN